MHHSHWIRLGVGYVVLLSVASLAAATSPALMDKPSSSWQGTDNQRQIWLEGLTLVTSGQFAKGSELIDKIIDTGLKDTQVQRVHDWLQPFDEMQAEREHRRSADYKKYAQWVQEDMEQERWTRAIVNCSKALLNTDDEDRFRSEPWVQASVAGALKAAEDYEKDHKWYKAGRIYVHLEQLFPLNASYREASERVQDLIRLELGYAKDSDWETAVSDITPLMAIQAFKRIDVSYLEAVDLKKCAISALRQMLRLTEEPKLSEVFKNVENTEDVEEFRDRVRSRLVQIQEQPDVDMATFIHCFDQVLQINNEIELFPQTMLIREFVHGTLQPLDRFSDMLWPADADEFNKHTQGKFTGVGISIRKERGKPIQVITPLEDAPAYDAGIRPGDQITKIDGKPAAPLTINAAVRLITGPPNTTVTLTIKRPGLDKEFDQKLTRAEITIYTIKGYTRTETGQWDFLIDPSSRIGYVRLTNFSEESSSELADTIKQLKRTRQIRGLILDLRGNPGGLLKAAVEIASLFLPGDKEIVSTRDRRGQDGQYFTAEPAGDHYPDMPMIVLVDSSSASASEIVSGALQVHGRALVVGERTFGKGSVQQVLPVTPTRMASLKLTTSRYYLPNGRCLHREEDSETWGVDPDVKVTLVPKEIVKIAEMRIKRDILKGRNQKDLTEEDFDHVLGKPSDDDGKTNEDKQGDPNKSSDDEGDGDDEEDEEIRDDPNEFPEIDPQLETALLLMRIRLETNHPWPHSPQQTFASHATADRSR